MRKPWLITAVAFGLILAVPLLSPPSDNARAADPMGLVDLRVGNPDICLEMYARGEGRLAYLQARLELTADQKALWDSWEAKIRALETQRRSQCQSNQNNSSSPGALEADSALTTALSMQLDAVKAARPALEALYHTLNSTQQAVFDRLWFASPAQALRSSIEAAPPPPFIIPTMPLGSPPQGPLRPPSPCGTF